VAHAAVAGKRQDRMRYTGLAVVAAAIVFAGFARTLPGLSRLHLERERWDIFRAEKSSHLAPHPD
jgi:hypothetical protein